MREVVGFNDYFITDCGSVYSSKSGKLKAMKQQTNQKGYLRCNLMKVSGGYSTVAVHRLVAIAYIDNPLDLPQVNHKDLNKNNNHHSNLEWISNKDNMEHAINSGVVFASTGESNGKSKFSEAQVLEIRQLHSTGSWTYADLGRKFNVTYSTISNIVKRNTWKHI